MDAIDGNGGRIIQMNPLLKVNYLRLLQWTQLE